jgi:YebC/PmpR family DNA-binding regulatory protein
MSGHSKWSTIKHKKAAKDARRGKLFTKLIKEITVAAKLGGGDLNANPRLRTAVNAAKANSMPNENIERAVKKGTGELDGQSYDEISYEGYGPGGAAILVRVMTDNRNRTVSEIRRLFTRHGGSMGESGCVAWMFQNRGTISVDKSAADEDRLIELSLEAGADDVVDDDSGYQISTTPDAFESVKNALESVGIAISSAEVGMVPQNTLSLSGDQAEETLKLLEELEEHDDVQEVASNFDISQEELERLSAA